MDDRPTLRQAGESEAPPRFLRKRRGSAGLSFKLLMLTILFVMVSAVLIYVPSIANFRQSWLMDRLTMADAASVVLARTDPTELPRQIQDDLLSAVGAIAIAIKTGEISRLIATVEMPPAVDGVADLRMMDPPGQILAAFDTLFSGGEQFLRVIGNSRSGATLELVISDRMLRSAMLRYSANIFWLSLLVSIITGALLYFSMTRMFVRPMRELSDNMVAFSEAPDDPGRIIVPSGRADEIGVAEGQLAAMQRDLQGTLREQRHLADLGLAVSKINHDLRNLLASAQLFSDRLSSLPDPTVQRFAPKLIGALDRAIAYCQSTLAYGRAREAVPARRLLLLHRLVEDVGDSLGLHGHATIAFENKVEDNLEVDADPDQLFRALINLGRNAVQALDGDQDPAVVRRLAFTGRRESVTVTITVEDTGPGVPEKARAHLFQAFQGGARPGGTGLGLAIAAELVHAHGGSIELIEHSGPGARFVIVIPDRSGRNGRNGAG